MPSIGLSPNDADEEFIEQFEALSDRSRVKFLFDPGEEFHDQFDSNELHCRVMDVNVLRTIAEITLSRAGNTFVVRIEPLDSGRTSLSLKINDTYAGTPMQLSW